MSGKSSFVSALAVAASLIVCGTTMAAASTYVFVSPSRIGVNKFLQMGKTGIEKAASAHGADVKIFEGTDPATRRDNVQAAIDLGAEIIAVSGFEFDDIISDLAPANPNTKFIIVDTCIADPGANVYCAVFREQEVSYLAGAEAALTSKAGIIATVAALDIPFLHRYADSYALGAAAARPDIKVLPTLWVGGDNPFQDPLRGQAQTQLQLSAGADRIYAVGAGSNGGIFKAVSNTPGAMAIGLDVNQCGDAPGSILDSALKQVDSVLPQMVDKVLAGSTDHVVAFGLAEGGLGLVGLTDGAADSGCEIVKSPDVIAKLQTLQAQVVSGEIKIPDPMAAQ
jgi:basic membrane protein A